MGEWRYVLRVTGCSSAVLSFIIVLLLIRFYCCKLYEYERVPIFWLRTPIALRRWKDWLQPTLRRSWQNEQNGVAIVQITDWLRVRVSESVRLHVTVIAAHCVGLSVGALQSMLSLLLWHAASETPRSRMSATGSTDVLPVRNEPVGICCWRQPDEHENRIK